MTSEVFKKIKFTINEKKHSVGSNIPPSTSLLQYLREFAKLPGSKGSCYEGGCGACTVVATTTDHETGGKKSFSLRTCQTLVYSCGGWAIETIEHLGNRYKGYHSLQKALTGFYGTQCGFCSPGFIMSMYGELKSKEKLTKERVEKTLDGNICRCTGYRPILDAFKSLAVDGPTILKEKLIDIEDSFEAVCPNSGEVCRGQCSSDAKNQEGCHEIHVVEPNSVPQTEIDLTVNEVRWFRPVSINGIYKILQQTEDGKSIRLVVGNTGQGVYKNDGPYNMYVDTTGVEDLYIVGVGKPLVLGANVCLNRCIEAFEETAKMFKEFDQLQEIANHWKYVANEGIRNTGSWAGNLMLKHAHHEFPSDIFLTLAIVEAKIQVGNSADSSISEMSAEELMEADMSKKVILSVKIPEQEPNTYIRTYKISPRTVNAHAYVNAAIKFTLDPNDGFKILSKPTLIFGGIKAKFVHASATELFLVNRRLTSKTVIIRAAKSLEKEVTPEATPQDASPEYRKNLVQCLFYKAVLNILGDNVSPEFRYGGSIIQRPISSGQQSYDDNKDTWPIGKGVPKLESNIQVSGEAEYVDDMENLTNELHGAFVQSTVANAVIKSIDPSEALMVSGVVTFIKAEDIPGKNSFVNLAGKFNDPIFASEKVNYCGQSLGLIVAERRDVALKAAKLVKVEYTDVVKPILTIKDALKGEENRVDLFEDEPFLKSAHVIEGELDQGSQFHMTMEPLIARVIPAEDGYDVYCATQWPTETQASLSSALGIPFNNINLSIRRIGGGYGGKISRGNILVCAAGVAANKLQKPVRIALDMSTHMTLVGWREPYLSSYKVGFSNEGLLETVGVELISDGGFAINEVTAGYAFVKIPSVYKAKIWGFKSKIIKTDTAANTYCRTPGSTEAIATMENIIEHVATFLKKDPAKIREINFLNRKTETKAQRYGPKGENLAATRIFPLLKEQADYDTRRAEIIQYNKDHRWRKRGLSMVPLFYKLGYPPVRYGVQIAIYGQDGTIVISHGGIEMGQGINTKAAQVAAKFLKAPYDVIVAKPTNLVVGANSSVTGGCFGSDLVCHGVKVCCEKLRERMSLIEYIYKKKHGKDPTWSELTMECLSKDVDLSERYWTATKEHPDSYEIFGSVCMEVEVDVLTGQFMMGRTDLIEDCGRSISPYIDIGQVEGAFIMGLGYYTSEIVKYNTETGAKVSNNTWEYKVPTALDIPTDLRVSFLSNDTNRAGVVRSKASGEPPLCMSYCVVSALRDAIASARKDAGITEPWFEMPTPLTVERVQMLCQTKADHFKLKSNEVQADEAADLSTLVNDFHFVESDEVPDVPEEGCTMS